MRRETVKSPYLLRITAIIGLNACIRLVLLILPAKQHICDIIPSICPAAFKCVLFCLFDSLDSVVQILTLQLTPTPLRHCCSQQLQLCYRLQFAFPCFGFPGTINMTVAQRQWHYPSSMSVQMQ